MGYLKLLFGIVVLAAGAFVEWALDARQPEPTAYAATLSDPGGVTIGSHDGFITIRPSGGRPAIGLLLTLPKSWRARRRISLPDVEWRIGNELAGARTFRLECAHGFARLSRPCRQI